jgi:hypothetical protein
MSFMQVRASMLMKEKLRQVSGAICKNRRDIAVKGWRRSLELTTRRASSPSSGEAILPSKLAEPYT